MMENNNERIIEKNAERTDGKNTEKSMETIETTLVNLLIDGGYHISFAESCTAGLAVGRLVNVADASKVLDVSFVTYANEAKIKYVNVNPQTIEKHGVVSEEVAGEMALGAARNAILSDSATDVESELATEVESEHVNDVESEKELCKPVIGVGISGIAGPTGGTATKPVGMVCFGFCISGRIATYTKQFGNIGRNKVREESVNFCYNKLVELLLSAAVKDNE